MVYFIKIKIVYKMKGNKIMEKVLVEWKDKGELLYLFANNSVLNFYPKFGFFKLNQYQCTKLISKNGKDGFMKKLNMSDECDRALVYNKANVLSSFSQVSIDEILNYLVNENIKRVKLYFTPKETDFYIKMPLEGEDTLFVLGKDTMLLEDNQFRFPALSHT